MSASGPTPETGPYLAANVDSFDGPLRLLLAIAARAAAASRLPPDSSISAEDIDIVTESLSAFGLNNEESKIESEKNAEGLNEDVKEVDVDEVTKQAKEIAASQAPKISPEEMKREREKQKRTLQVVESANSAARQQRKKDAREWADAIARHCKLDPAALPPSPRAADVKPAVKGLSSEKHADMLHDILLLSLHLPPPPKNDNMDPRQAKEAKKPPPENAGVYTPLARYLVFATSQILNIPLATVYSAEKAMAQQLYFVLNETKKAEAGNDSNTAASAADRERMKAASSGAIAEREKQSSTWKWAATGAGFLAGGAIIGLTGGLAAPLIAPLLVTATGGALSFLATSGGAVLLGTMFGLTGGGLTAFRAKRRMEGVEEFEFVKIEEEDVPNIPSLSATIVASGFLTKPGDWIDPYKETFLHKTRNSKDVFALKAETGVMLRAGVSLDGYVKNFLIGKGISEIIKRTALAAVFSAIALPTTVYKTATKALDNDFQQATDRATKAGIILADVLEKGVQGNRPTILIGSSLGAVTIMTCLLELHKRDLSGLVFDAILISLPAAPSPTEWLKMRQVTSRRLVNAYSQNDWVLAIIARLHTLISTKLSFGVAGLQAVNVGYAADGTPIVENIDLSSILNGHLELASQMTQVLDRIGMEA